MDSPYFDGTYFDPAYFDASGAGVSGGSASKGGKPSRMQILRDPEPELENEDYVDLIL